MVSNNGPANSPQEWSQKIISQNSPSKFFSWYGNAAVPRKFMENNGKQAMYTTFVDGKIKGKLYKTADCFWFWIFAGFKKEDWFLDIFWEYFCAKVGRHRLGTKRKGCLGGSKRKQEGGTVRAKTINVLVFAPLIACMVVLGTSWCLR